MSILKHFNWIDVVMFALAVRIIYVGLKAGFVVEFLKILGSFVTLYVCFHYYAVLAHFLVRKSSISVSLLETFVFALGWLLIFLACWLIREGLLKLFKVEAQSLVDKWGGLALALGRFFITASLLLFLFLLTGSEYLQKMTIKSFTHKYLVPVAPNIYASVQNGIIGKIFPAQRYNLAVSEQLRKIDKR